ncbi:MAG TPA: hypothetical protein VHD15_09945 [Hyphomicrobiales bacterium]|nr:hypothetical protein [Hyphomicrobiales bacterium]
MSFRLRETCETFPSRWWQWQRDGSHFLAKSGTTVVGMVWLDATALDTSWRWSITVLDPWHAANGRAASRSEASADLETAWRSWLAQTGLCEIDEAACARRAGKPSRSRAT